MPTKQTNQKINNLIFMDCTPLTRRCQITEYTECEECFTIIKMKNDNDFICNVCKEKNESC